MHTYIHILSYSGFILNGPQLITYFLFRNARHVSFTLLSREIEEESSRMQENPSQEDAEKSHNNKT